MVVLGAIISLISGIMFLSSNTAIKNEKNWNDFMEHMKKQDSPIANYPEDVIYSLVCKINRFSCIILIIGLMLLGAGIALTATVR
jgi:hypothetical protein